MSQQLLLSEDRDRNGAMSIVKWISKELPSTRNGRDGTIDPYIGNQIDGAGTKSTTLCQCCHCRMGSSCCGAHSSMCFHRTSRCTARMDLTTKVHSLMYHARNGGNTWWRWPKRRQPCQCRGFGRRSCRYRSFVLIILLSGFRIQPHRNRCFVCLSVVPPTESTMTSARSGECTLEQNTMCNALHIQPHSYSPHTLNRIKILSRK